MCNTNNFKICDKCNSVIPRDREVVKKTTLKVKMPYGVDEIPMLYKYCPVCGNWLYSIYDSEAENDIGDKNKTVIKEEIEKDDDCKINQFEQLKDKIKFMTSKSIENLDEKIKDTLSPKGTVIVIEGTDGSGKRTQSEMLLNRLLDMGIKASLYSFPNYDSLQGKLVKRYLNGEFKNQPCKEAHNEWYRNAVMYANDRLVTCMEKGEDGRSILEKYNDGEVLIFDRYTQSNFIHQGCHIDDQDDLEDFIAYMSELEYDILGLPKPDKVIYLKVAPEMSMQNIEKRGNEKDIHENLESLKKANRHVNFLIDWLGWDSINCSDAIASVDTGKEAHYMYPKDHIHREVFSLVEGLLAENNQTRHIKYCTECMKADMYTVIRPRCITNNDKIKIGACPTCGTLYDMELI